MSWLTEQEEIGQEKLSRGLTATRARIAHTPQDDPSRPPPDVSWRYYWVVFLSCCALLRALNKYKNLICWSGANNYNIT